MNKTVLFLFTFLSTTAFAQVPNFLDTTYNIRVERNITYAQDTNYAGRLETLTLDLYKPINDNNKFRPVFIMVHGGAWLTGTKDDADIVTFASLMAKRGYVVASINYRKGWHMSASVANPVFKDQNPLNPNDENPLQCQYAPDTAELIRANYRGMQDAKSAIRWLRARSSIDSTCKANYYIGGASAGGFIAQLTAFMDLPTEKPTQTNALATVPVPDPKLVFCNKLNNPAAFVVNRARPDLGSIEGRTNLNGESTRVKGIVSIFGGLMENQIGTSIISGPDTPAIFMYHQECDIVVPFNRAAGNAPFSSICIPLLAFTPPYFPTYTPVTNVPIFLGSNYLNTYYNSLPVAQRPRVKFSPVLNGAPTAASCLANPPCHSLPNVLAYTDTVARFLKPTVDAVIANAANGCQSTVTGIVNVWLSKKINVYPNPFQNNITIELPKTYLQVTLQLMDITGKVITSTTKTNTGITVQLQTDKQFSKGVYFLQVKTIDGIAIKKLLHY